MADGWIKVWRRLLNHPCLTQHDERGLWLTLLLRAAHEPTEVRFRGKVVKLARGQLAISLREEADRGGTSHKRLRNIIDLMRREKMLTLDTAKGTHFCVLTICNYEHFQAEGAQPKARKGHSRGTVGAQSGHTEQEGEELKKKNPSPDGEGGQRPEDADPLGLAITAWNEICGDLLPRVSKLTEDRKRALKLVLAEECGGNIANWQTYCRRIRASRFCCGENSRNWRADIDFALKSGRYTRVLEGKYDNGSPAVAAYVRPSRKSYHDLVTESLNDDEEHGSEAAFGVPGTVAILRPGRADDDPGGYGRPGSHLRAVAGGL